MEIREFVAKALTEILDGIRDAQQDADGSLVNAAPGNAQAMGGNLFKGQFGVFTRMDFDLAVTAESKVEKGGEAKLSVVGIGVGGSGGSATTSQSVSRIAFSIPIQLPDGDQSRAEEFAEKRRALREASAERQKAAWKAYV